MEKSSGVKKLDIEGESPDSGYFARITLDSGDTGTCDCPRGSPRCTSTFVREASLMFLITPLKLFFMPPEQDAGQAGECLAASWLSRERSYSVVTRNWRSPKDRRDEVDLVCDDRGVLVFVEVKARAADALVPGYHAIDRRKKKALRRAITSYLRQLRVKPKTFRFDVVEISLTPDVASSVVRHFENVPLFSKHFRV